jgi:hypothetical protein
LRTNGVKTRVNVVEAAPKEVSEAIASLKEEAQVRVAACNEAAAAKVIAAPPIDEETFNVLNSKPQRTAAENDQITRYNIERLAAPKTWSTELVTALTRDNGEIMKAYRRCARMRDYEERSELETQISEGKHIIRDQLKLVNKYDDPEELNVAARLHANPYYDGMEVINDFIKAAGFKNCLDKSKIEINYEALRRYVEEKRGILEILWKGSKLKGEQNRNLMKYVDTKLQSYGFKITRASKSKKCKQHVLTINHHELFKTHGIE